MIFSNPLTRPWHFSALELVVFVCFGLAVKHALGEYRRGDKRHAFQLAVILFYGVLMELVAFSRYQNYVHGQFTVQLYRNQLPLYIPCVYVVLHYTGIKLVERLRLSLWPEALLVGFSICMLDVPFDIVGAQVGWWRWSDTDPTVAYRWLGVPVTSYYWYLLFTPILAALCRLSWKRWHTFATAPLIAVLVFVFGVLAFIPFHVLVRAGVSAGTIVSAHLAACALLALFVRTRDAVQAPRAILAIAVSLPALFVIVLATGGATGGKLAAIAAAATASMFLAVILPLRALPAVAVSER